MPEQITITRTPWQGLIKKPDPAARGNKFLFLNHASISPHALFTAADPGFLSFIAAKYKGLTKPVTGFPDLIHLLKTPFIDWYGFLDVQFFPRFYGGDGPGSRHSFTPSFPYWNRLLNIALSKPLHRQLSAGASFHSFPLLMAAAAPPGREPGTVKVKYADRYSIFMPPGVMELWSTGVVGKKLNQIIGTMRDNQFFSSSIDLPIMFSHQAFKLPSLYTFERDVHPGMRQSRPKCKIFGRARRPAPTKECRGDPLWSPVSRKFDFDVALDVRQAKKVENLSIVSSAHYSITPLLHYPIQLPRLLSHYYFSIDRWVSYISPSFLFTGPGAALTAFSSSHFTGHPGTYLSTILSNRSETTQSFKQKLAAQRLIKSFDQTFSKVWPVKLRQGPPEADQIIPLQLPTPFTLTQSPQANYLNRFNQYLYPRTREAVPTASTFYTHPTSTQWDDAAAGILILEKLSLFNKKISENFRKYYIMLPVLCKIRHTPAAAQPPLSRGELSGSIFIDRLFGQSPLERGASSVVKMEEAGCVKIRMTDSAPGTLIDRRVSYFSPSFLFTGSSSSFTAFSSSHFSGYPGTYLSTILSNGNETTRSFMQNLAARRLIKSFDQTFSKVWPLAGPPEADQIKPLQLRLLTSRVHSGKSTSSTSSGAPGSQPPVLSYLEPSPGPSSLTGDTTKFPGQGKSTQWEHEIIYKKPADKNRDKIDLKRLTDQVYQQLSRRIKKEREMRGW